MLGDLQAFTFHVIAQEELFEPGEANVMGKTANP
jgi:hypothetical protein